MSGPPQWLVDLPDDELFERFVRATATLKVDENGLQCPRAEAVVLAGLARQVQERSGIESPLNRLATRVMSLLGYYANANVPNPELVAMFNRDLAELAACVPTNLRVELADFLPANLPDLADFLPARGPRFVESDDADAIAANEAAIEQARRD